LSQQIVKKIHLQEKLGRYILEESELWIDGTIVEDRFRFSDGRMMKNIVSKDDGLDNACASIAKHNGNVTLTTIDCNSDLNGYICQYPFTNPT